MFLYLSIFISYRNHQKRLINVRHLLKVVLEIIVLQRHLVAISVLHLSCKGVYFVPWLHQCVYVYVFEYNLPVLQ